MATAAVLEKLSTLSDKGKDHLAKELVRNLGDLSKYKITKNYVLVGLYIGGKFHAGTKLVRVNANEDTYQSNCGLIIKSGPSAFKLDTGLLEPDAPANGDWVYYRGGFQRMQIHGMDYAFLHEDNIVGTVPEPSAITHRI